MTRISGWTLAIAGGCTGLALMGILTDAGAGTALLPAPTRIALMLAMLACIPLFYVLWGRRMMAQEAAYRLAPYLLIPVGGVLAFLNPNMLCAQVLLHPLWWSSTRTRGAGITLSTLGVLTMTAGSILGQQDPHWVPTILVVAVISLIFAIAMGLWISRIQEIGQENAHLVAELRSREAQIAALNRDVGAVQERGRLSRDLHDTVAQTLTGVVMLSRRALRQAETGAAGLTDTVRLIETSAAEALAETRGLVAAASSLEGSTLADTLTRFCERFGRETGIAVRIRVAEDSTLSRAAEVILLRCVQEGLANIRKHAHATDAGVELITDSAGSRLRITDNGRGPGSASPATGGQFGLAGLAERLAEAGGSVALEPGTRGGARLTVILPPSAPRNNHDQT